MSADNKNNRKIIAKSTATHIEILFTFIVNDIAMLVSRSTGVAIAILFYCN